MSISRSLNRDSFAVYTTMDRTECLVFCHVDECQAIFIRTKNVYPLPEVWES